MKELIFSIWGLSLLAWLTAFGLSLAPSLRPPPPAIIVFLVIPFALVGYSVILPLMADVGTKLWEGLFFAVVGIIAMHPAAVIWTGVVGGVFYALKAFNKPEGLALTASALWIGSAGLMTCICISMRSLFVRFNFH